MALAGDFPEDNILIAATVLAQGPRLRAFVRRQVADLQEADDIVQETFAELVRAYRLTQPIEHVAAWLLRVARNRIIDGFRRRGHAGGIRDDSFTHVIGADGEPLPRAEEGSAPAASGPESAYLHAQLAAVLEAALEELPPAQREVFIAHELEGRSFKALAAATGVGVNTLLARKHAAVQHLRRRLRDIHSEFEP